MFKILTTLFRGAAAAAEERVADQHALLILDQQIRDVAAAVDRSKKALAIAMAQEAEEARRLAATEARIADLETRTAEALKAGRDDLAQEGAEAIAGLETDRNAIAEARATFGREIAGLKRAVTQASRRLAELERGRRVANAAESVRRLRAGSATASAYGSSSLAEAEATLKRLRERQAEAAAADQALQEIDTETAPVVVAEKLEAAGFGNKTRPSAADVLERLRRRNAAGPATA
jgi:phage shock protein A